MSTTLSVRLLGSFELRLDDRPLAPLPSPRTESLLAYLVLHSETPVVRQHLAFRLWPESTESQARTNLRHVLHDLRRALPNADDSYLHVTPRTLRWQPAATVRLDVAEFDAAVSRAETLAQERATGAARDNVIAALREAVDLYRGDLLETCYDEWISAQRTRLRKRFLSVLERLAILLGERGDHADAIVSAERLVGFEPLREDAWRLLMRLKDARGDRAGALEAYETCVATLERELGVAPTEVTRQAYETLLRPAHLRESTDGHGRQGGRRQAVPALIGRAEEWARLTKLWRTVEGGQPAFLLVTGEAGVGKSRLVAELAAWCTLRGGVTADARSYSAEGALAYAPLITWLRAPAMEKAFAQLGRPRLSELSRLLPELLSRVPGVPHPPSLPEDDLRHRLFDAAAHALLSLGSPLLLIADDIQWCDQETMRFLHYLLRSAPKAPLLVAATARAEDIGRSPPLGTLITGLRTLGLVTDMELARLTRSATCDLASTLTAEPLDDTGTDALFRETEGNPLFVIEAMRAGWRPGGRGTDALTPRVQAVIASRLGQLSDAARAVVDVAATLGRDFTVDTLARAADRPVEALAPCLDELFRTRILRVDDAGTYDFDHDKIREVTYVALSPPARCQHHLRAAIALKQLAARGHDQLSGQVAAHYERAGVAEEAIAWYEIAAEASQRLYASREAVRWLTRARELVRSLPGAPERHARELAILTALLTPVASVDGFASQSLGEIQQRAVDLARTLGADLPPQLMRSLAISSLSRDDFDAARHYGERLRDRGATDGDDALLVESEYVSGIAAFWRGEFRTARTHFETAVGGYHPDHRSAHLLRYWLDPQVVCLSRLGNTLWFLGDPVAACRARDDALALADTIGHEPSRRAALVFAVVLALDMGDTANLRRYATALESGVTDYDARPNRLATEAFRSYLRVLDGEIAEGIAGVRAALDEVSDGGHAPGQRATLARLLIASYEAACDPRGRLAAAEDALAMAGATLWEAEAHRARAEALAELGAASHEVLAAFDRALAVARRQGAVMLEHRAAASRDRLLGLRDDILVSSEATRPRDE